MQKTAFSLMIGTSLLFATSACQPKAKTSNISSFLALTTELQNTQMLLKIEKPTASAGIATMAEDCAALNESIQKIDGRSQIEAIYGIQEQLDACLPTADNIEVISLLKSYQAMYRRFLTDEIDLSDEDFNSVIYDLYYGEGVSTAQLKTMSLRVQYLIGLINSNADVKVRDLGEGFFSFDHNLTVMTDIFSPHLNEDQSQFIERMAVDNQEILWGDAAVAISFAQLIERATFWEDYIERYPTGYSIKDARSLLNLYRHILFFGSDNTQWTDDAISEYSFPEHRRMVMQLIRRPDSILAEDARNFLSFLMLSDSERQQQYPAPNVDENGYAMNDWAKVRYQLNKALQIPAIWDASNNRDCLQGVFCIDYSIE